MNSCPDSVAGHTIVCRKCKTQITVPEGKPDPWWARQAYWIAVALIELAAIGALAACIVLLRVGRPPASLPLLDPKDTGGEVCLAIPGQTVPLRWRTDRESADGFFAVAGQSVVLRRGVQAQLSGVQVTDNPWPSQVFRTNPPPPAKPIVIGLRIPLPEDESMAGEQAILGITVNIEYPGWAKPGGPPSLQQASLKRDWAFVAATSDERRIFERYLARRVWLERGAYAAGGLILVVALGAALLAQRHVNITCPKCGRVTSGTYLRGGRKLYISPCPHKGGSLRR